MRTLVILTLLLLGPSLWAGRPNILLIMADDLGYADVGFNGSPDIRTPHLDQLAEGGTVCSSAYVVHPFCGPSRMGLLSGRYPHAYGAPYNLPPWNMNAYREKGIGREEKLISRVLQDAGYMTGLMGKWHLGEQEMHHPNERGFDEFWGFLGGGKLYFGPYVENNAAGTVWTYKTYPEHNGTAVKHLTKEDYLTDVLTDQGVEFIHRAADEEQPFFLFMSYNAPHTMLEATEADMAVFPELTGKRKIYAGMVYAMDRGVGRLVDVLKETGAYENTLIIFLSDNGGRTDEGANNAPLRGTKGDVLEGGFRVPMLFHWAGVVTGGTVYDHPVSALDLYPTLAALAQAEAEVPGDKKLDGVNLWQDFLSGTSARKGGMIFCMRHRDGFSDISARRDEWKVVSTGGTGKWKLYRVDRDPGETEDLSRQYPERVERMVSEVRKWAAEQPRPEWFDSYTAEERWNNLSMPRDDLLFGSMPSE